MLVKMEFGSQIYGTNLPTSDTDYKSIFIPDYKDIILQRPPKTIQNNTKKDEHSKNTAEDIDFEQYALHYWMKLFIEGQTVCYDMLFCPDKHILATSPEWEEIKKNKEKLINSKITSFAGYCQSQAAKYSLKGSNLAAYEMTVNLLKEKHQHLRLMNIKDEIQEKLIKVAQNDMKYNDKGEPLIKIVQIPHKITGLMEEYLQVGPKTKVPLNAKVQIALESYEHQIRQYGERAKQAKLHQGVDWKALMHAVRVCKEAEELLLTGNISFPRPEKELLLKIRKGELPYEEVAELIVQGLDSLNEAKNKSTLRQKPDVDWIENFIYNTYKESK
jgi:predicted nucleotidyltransferase